MEVTHLAAARNATTPTPKNGRGASRLSFAKVTDTLTVPDLLALQTESFDWLVGNDTWKTRLADGAGLAFARSQASTLSYVYDHVAIAADPSMLKGRRFGNVVMYASNDPLPFDAMPRRLASDPAPAKLVEGDELRRFIAGAPVVTDATAVPSPPPARSIFLAKPGG